MKIKLIIFSSVLLLSIQSCWLRNINPNNSAIKEIYFEQFYSTSLKNGKISKNDTLWLQLKPNFQQIDYKTKQSYTLQNASFALSARLQPVKTSKDLKAFSNNFEIVMRKGKLVNISFANYEDFIIDFDMRYGCPFGNEVDFGIVCKEKGIYRIATGGNVFFGQNRTDCNDFTYKNEYGYFVYRFRETDNNQTIFESLTLQEKQKYELHASQKSDKTVIFFEITD